MGQYTGIEWTDATWNPTTGCTKISPGCDNCYAAELAHTRLRETYLRQPPINDSPEAKEDPFAIRLWPDRLDQPIRWKNPRMVFVNSMSDLFHQDIPEDFLRRIFRTMLEVDRHVFQVLTKRPARACRFWDRNSDLFEGGQIPSHIWMGTSIEKQEYDYRARQLRSLPAELRFLSCEPLLGQLKLDLTGIGWVIVGGESGPRYRPLDLRWARGIRDQCIEAEVPFFFKQIGGRTPKAGGRILDNRTWGEYPEVERLTA